MNNAAIQVMSSQVLQDNVVRDSGKDVIKIQVNIHRLSFTHQLGHPIKEGDEVGQDLPFTNP